ncbi:ABC transporter [Aurantiacibacter sp. MUD61]|uniref:ABC transporter n=1 Tax=Aurantiacibacter sp. MUD61 TaxID=3009083 RepID=UPI0022F08F56|nr:ABC transporter [Aurantiacibacter sp. MUD61]
MRSCNRLLAVLALLLSAPVAAQEPAITQADPARPQLALMGTIPIYWGEADGMGDLIRGEAHAHWARDVIEEHAQPIPLDYLTPEALAPFNMLLMAQPRGLTAEENVALDAWVRGGGRLLLFADPMMTGESRFHIGDRRRPQDVALLSPILTHWGLELWLDDTQDEGLYHIDPNGDPIPVNMAGTWRSVGEARDCVIEQDDLLARCAIGGGEVLLVADAALLDIMGPYDGATTAFDRLLTQAFPDFGDQAGNDGQNAATQTESPELSSNSNCHAGDANHECAQIGEEDSS